MQADLPELELRRALLTHKADEDEHDGDILRNDGRNGNTRNVQLTDDHKEQIQENVQHAGNGEEDERALRIAVGAEDGGGEIVDQRAGNADEIDAQSGVSIHSSIGVERKKPSRNVTTPRTRLRAMALWTARPTRASSRQPA